MFILCQQNHAFQFQMRRLAFSTSFLTIPFKRPRRLIFIGVESLQQQQQ